MNLSPRKTTIFHPIFFVHQGLCLYSLENTFRAFSAPLGRCYKHPPKKVSKKRHSGPFSLIIRIPVIWGDTKVSFNLPVAKHLIFSPRKFTGKLKTHFCVKKCGKFLDFLPMEITQNPQGNTLIHPV